MTVKRAATQAESQHVSTKHVSTKQIKRRTIVAGAAWSVPVIALAVGVPTLSASPAPVPEYLFSGISAQGDAGETLTGSRRPGARIRTTVAEGSQPVLGQVVTFAYVSGPFTLLQTTATTDSFGAARVGVTFAEGALPGTLGAIVATWVGPDGVSYSSNIDVSVSEG